MIPLENTFSTNLGNLNNGGSSGFGVNLGGGLGLRKTPDGGYGANFGKGGLSAGAGVSFSKGKFKTSLSGKWDLQQKPCDSAGRGKRGAGTDGDGVGTDGDVAYLCNSGGGRKLAPLLLE